MLVTIKTEVPKKFEEMGLQSLEYIIIDTNYHFCNIFGNDDIYYNAYQQNDLLKNENFNIWFLWAYRQLEKLIENSSEKKIVKTTADCIENNLTSKKTQFWHVFSPTVLVPSKHKEGILTGTLKSLLNAMLKEKDYIIPEFNELCKSKKGKCVDFEIWTKNLTAASNIDTSDRFLSFLDMLVKAVNMISEQERPENIIPLSIYQPTLRQYTDKDRGDVVASIRDLKIYKRFYKLMKQ